MPGAHRGESGREQRSPEGTDVAAVQHLKVVRDEAGNLWICPEGVDERGDLASQGCWRSGDRWHEGLPERTDEQPGREGRDEPEDSAEGANARREGHE
jgi:hypothetical protein